MYNYSQISPFIMKAHREAQEAAQAVYDKYEAELIQRIKNQLADGDVIYFGMGTAWLNEKKGENYLIARGMKFTEALGSIEYNDVRAGFSVPAKIEK